MATPNFANINASRIFALTPNADDETSLAYEMFNEDIDYVLEDVRNTINSKLEANPNTADVSVEEGNAYDYANLTEYRSYGQNVFATVIDTSFMYEQHITVVVWLIYRSGYYSGANLDYQYEVTVNSTDCGIDNVNSIFDVFSAETEQHNPELLDMVNANATTIHATIINRLDTLIATVEEVYTTHTTPLTCVAVFSNGEAIYAAA